MKDTSIPTLDSRLKYGRDAKYAQRAILLRDTVIPTNYYQVTVASGVLTTTLLIS